MKTCLAILLASLLLTATAHAQNKRDIAVRNDKQQLSSNDSWFYDELDTALDVATKTKRPLMIVFR